MASFRSVYHEFSTVVPQYRSKENSDSNEPASLITGCLDNQLAALKSGYDLIYSSLDFKLGRSQKVNFVKLNKFGQTLVYEADQSGGSTLAFG